jgi:hypothetical protein
VGAAIASIALVARAAEPGAQEGVLLLRSGGVLRGEISQNGDRYVVRGEKSEMDVAATQVAIVGKSLHDVYEQQRGQIVRPSAEPHLGLAEWCLRYELLAETARELETARSLDAHHPRVALLERRLAVVQAPRRSATAAADSSKAKESLVNELRDLEAMAAELPAGTVERFTRRVQPLLVNSCTTSGCHQSGGEQKFQLDRAVLHGLSNRRTTLRNLSAVLSLVDRSAPPGSQLLTIPTEAHAGRKPPLLGKLHEEHLTTLAEWVALATGTEVRPSEVASADAMEQDRAAEKSSPRDVHQASAAMPTPAEQMMTDQENATIFENLAPPRYGVDLRPWQPKDEFDPEIFNRQFARPIAGPSP